MSELDKNIEIEVISEGKITIEWAKVKIVIIKADGTKIVTDEPISYKIKNEIILKR